MARFKIPKTESYRKASGNPQNHLDFVFSSNIEDWMSKSQAKPAKDPGERQLGKHLSKVKLERKGPSHIQVMNDNLR